MTDKDPVLQGLAALPRLEPPAPFSQELRVAAHDRLLPAKVHPGWSVAVAASVVAYLGWALLYTGQL